MIRTSKIPAIAAVCFAVSICPHSVGDDSVSEEAVEALFQRMSDRAVHIEASYTYHHELNDDLRGPFFCYLRWARDTGYVYAINGYNSRPGKMSIEADASVLLKREPEGMRRDILGDIRFEPSGLFKTGYGWNATISWFAVYQRGFEPRTIWTVHKHRLPEQAHPHPQAYTDMNLNAVEGAFVPEFRLLYKQFTSAYNMWEFRFVRADRTMVGNEPTVEAVYEGKHSSFDPRLEYRITIKEFEPPIITRAEKWLVMDDGPLLENRLDVTWDWVSRIYAPKEIEYRQYTEDGQRPARTLWLQMREIDLSRKFTEEDFEFRAPSGSRVVDHPPGGGKWVETIVP